MGSILRSTDGVSKFEMPREGVVVITFDDMKTTAAKIIQALEKGRFTVKGKPVYVNLAAPSQQGAFPGKNAPSPHGSFQGEKSQSPQEFPLYITSPDSNGTMSR
jgi:hypothetical protein